jgi:pyruvate,water dikinase
MGVCAVGASTAVFRLTRRWLDDADGRLANRFLAGAGGMNSADNGLALYRLAAWAKTRPALARALAAPGSWAQTERRLGTVESGPEFIDRWRSFMAQHGHQARGGMDPAQPRWAELPDHVLDVLRACLEMTEAADPIALQAQRLEQRALLMADCRRRLRSPLKRALLAMAVRASHRGLIQRENLKIEGVRLVAIVRRALLEAGRRLAERGALSEPGNVFFMKLDELKPALCGGSPRDIQATVAARRAEHERFEQLAPPPVIRGRYEAHAPPTPAPDGDSHVLEGVAVSAGVATGRARVILQADARALVLPGEILVAPYTDPGWTPYFLPAAGIVVDIGGLLSHGSVVAREYGLPAVVNVGSGTRRIRTGDLVQVDGNRGRVVILGPSSNPP